MEEKFKKTIKTSKQGVWIVLILNAIVNILAIIGSKSIFAYLEGYWISIIYMTTLIIGLVLYKKEKYYEGAEIVQWTALGNVIIQFVHFITYYIITKLVMVNIFSFLLGTIIPVILIVESLKVIRLCGAQKRNLKTTIIAIIIIAVLCVTEIISIIYLMDRISSISSSNSNNDPNLNIEDTQIDNDSEEANKENIMDRNERHIANEEVSAYFLGEMSNVAWCSKQAGINEKKEWGIHFYIENEKLYYEENNNKSQLKTVKGTPIKVGGYINGGILVVKVLTSDGNVWSCEPLETAIDDFKIVKSLKDDKIINMGKISRGDSYEEFYYETQNGNIINEFGFELEVVKQRMLDSYALVLAEIYIGKDRRISYIQGEYEQEGLKYIGDIRAKRIYFNMNYEKAAPCYIVLSEDDKLYQIVFDTNAHLNINVDVQLQQTSKATKVENISYYFTGEDDDKAYFVEFKMNDGTVVTNEIAEIYYNAETFNTMQLN